MIKYLLRIITLFSVLLVSIGCQDGGKIRVHNKTNFDISSTIENHDYTVKPDESLTVKVDTDNSFLWLEDGAKKYSIKLIGETYRVTTYDNKFSDWVDIKVKAKETYDIYCKANYASLKIANNSDKIIEKVSFRKISPSVTSVWFVADRDEIKSNETRFVYLKPANEENNFFYNFKVEFNDGSILEYGDQSEGHKLKLDEQFVIDINNF